MNEPILICSYQLKFILYLDFLSFYPISFFCPRILSRIPRYIQFGCEFLKLSLFLFLFFMTLTVLRSSGHLSCIMSSDGICLMFFLWLDWGFGSLEEDTDVKCCFHHITSGHRLFTWMIMVGHLAEAMCQISPLSFTSLPHCPLWKEVPCTAHI